ncbi:hypothetical protein IEQ34_016781 [Dendrobium chrysotoxum]|uniref:EF-hand domain-containing protein n=1 Tax=Dendrobium chrysotoxum TaxID=161865 RepID=A0AAV7GF73_DENCH|nr:hypothetical protein IEQ34_016781 [Dendrobium chrysotoxum]
MKLINIGSLFSKKFKSNLKKNRSNNSRLFRSMATTTSSSDLTTSKSALRIHDTWSPYFSTTSDLFGVFDSDGDGDGKITKRELEIVLRRLSPKPLTEEELASMISEIDRDGDGCISLEELGAIGPSALGRLACGGELRDAFAVFDADGDGKISAEELLGVFLALGDGGCTLEDCHRMIGGVDSDGDGFVCFEDFARMMGRTEKIVEERQTVLPGRIIGVIN